MRPCVLSFSLTVPFLWDPFPLEAMTHGYILSSPKCSGFNSKHFRSHQVPMGEEFSVFLTWGVSWGCRQAVSSRHMQAWLGWRAPGGLTHQASGWRPQSLVTWASPCERCLSICTTWQLVSAKWVIQESEKGGNGVPIMTVPVITISATFYTLSVSLRPTHIQGEEDSAPCLKWRAPKNLRTDFKP